MFLPRVELSCAVDRGEHPSEPDAPDAYAHARHRWCAGVRECTELVCCSKCAHVLCTECVEQNFGQDAAAAILAKGNRGHLRPDALCRGSGWSFLPFVVGLEPTAGEAQLFAYPRNSLLAKPRLTPPPLPSLRPCR